VADAVNMPVEHQTFDSVYCSHNLEHYDTEAIPQVLNGFRSALKDNGYAYIRVPDIGELDEKIAAEGLTMDSHLYNSPAGPITVRDVKEGFQKEVLAGNEYYRHRTSFTRDLLESVLLDAGFKNIQISKGDLELIAIASL
jgi:predicted SAM-dependent methyltransferase